MQMSEWREQMSEWTSEWRNTYVPITDLSEPACALSLSKYSGLSKQAGAFTCDEDHLMVKKIPVLTMPQKKTGRQRTYLK